MDKQQLKVTDLRIGDKVRDKRTRFPLIVTGIIWYLGDDLTDATLWLDFDGNEGPDWELELGDVELIGKGDER